MATYVREPRSQGITFAGTFGGTLAAFGLLALIAGIVTAVGAAIDADTNLTNAEWRRIGIGGAVGIAAALFVSFMFGAYIAGRMALGSGLRNGLVVFLLGLLVFAVAAIVTNAVVDTANVQNELEASAVPTSGDVWTDIGVGAAIAAFVAMLAGSLLGGWLGGIWRPEFMLRPIGAEERTETVDLRQERAHEHDRHDDGNGRRTDDRTDDAEPARVVTYADGSIAEADEAESGR